MKKIFRNGLFTVLMTLVSGQIFAQFTGSMPVTQAVPGTQVVVPILAQASGINAFNIGVKFDPAVLTFQSVDVTGTPLASALFTNNLNGNELQMAFIGSNLSVTDTLLKIVFTYNAQGGVSQLLWNREYTEFTGANNQLMAETLTNGALFSNAVPNLVSATNGDQEICELGTAQFSVTAAGATAFQWQRSTDGGATFTNLTNGAGVSGATSASLSVANQSQTASGNYFQCVVSDASGNALSVAQRLKVNAVVGVSVTVTANPAGAACEGTSVTYSATPSSAVNNPVYQWRVNGVAAGNNATLVRSDLDQGDVVSCEISSSECVSGTGNLTAQVSALPAVFNVTGGGAFCVGDSGVSVGLSGSASGVSYQLMLGGQAQGSVVAGTGQALNFGLQTAVGTYTVQATNASSCVAMMTGDASISTNPLPVANAGQDVSIFVGNNIQLQASGGANYSWSPATGLSATNIANPIASPAVTTTYYVTVSTIFGCSATDSVVVTVNQLPVVNAGTDTAVCAGTAAFALSGTPAGGSWSGNGITSASLGTFDPNVAGAGIWNLVYTVTDGVNYTVNDTVAVTVNALPAVTFGTIGNFCIDAAAITLTTGLPTGGTYSGVGVANGAFNPALAGVGTHVLYYSFTDSNSCGNIDSISVVVNPLPTVSLAPLASVCINAASVTLSGGMPAGGTYSGVGVSNGAFDPAVAGVGTHAIIYTYTDPQTNCTAADTAEVVVSPLPVVDFPALGSFCINAAALPLNMATPAGGIYSGTGVNNNQFLPQLAGIGSFVITYTYTDSLTGCSNSDTSVIVVNDVPLVTLDSLSAICISGTAFTLNGGLPAGGTYSGVGVVNGVFNPALAGVGTHQITYTYTDSQTGCGGSASRSITVNPGPGMQIVASGPTSFCVGGAVTLTANPSAGVSYVWLLNDTVLANQNGNSLLVNASGSYRVFGTDSLTGCSDTSAAVMVTVNPVPLAAITAAGATTFCAGNNVTLNAQPTGSYSYVWLLDGAVIGGAQGASLVAAVAGNYRVLVTDSATACFDTSAAVQVTVNAVPVAGLTAAGATTFCDGGSVVLNAAPATGVTYVWLRDGAVVAGQTGASLTAMAAGAYRVIITNPSSCFDTSAAVTVTVNAAPTAGLTAAGATTFCAGGSVVLNATPATGVTYAWLLNGAVVAGQTGASLTATAAGAYRVIVTNPSSCFDTSAAVTVTVNAAPTAGLTAAGATTFCAGGSVVLNATPATGVTYAWLLNGAVVAGQTGASLTATAAGAYRVIVTNPSSCFDTSAAVTVTVNAVPSAGLTAGGATTICEGSSVQLNAAPATGVTYVWLRNGTVITGQTGATLSATLAGAYRVIVTNPSSCFDTSAVVTVTVNPRPAAPTITISATSDTLFSSVATGNQWFLNGAAISGATSQSLVITQNGTYRAVVTDGNSCASDSSNALNVINVSVVESFALNLNLYPNPSNGKAWISLDLPAYGTLELEVLTTTGQRVHFEQHRDASGQVQLEIDLPNVADGLYFVRVQQGAYSGMRRLMLRK